MRSIGLAGIMFVLATACGADDPGTRVHFDLAGAIDTPATFFDHPFPSDLRLDADGVPVLTGYPNPKDIVIIKDLLGVAGDRKKWPAQSVAYFRFDAPITEAFETQLIPPATTSTVLLIDIDASSPTRGRLFPTVAKSLIFDEFVGCCMLAVAPWPGIILEGPRTYAFVVMKSFGDAEGAELGTPGALSTLMDGGTPGGELGTDAATVFGPLRETLQLIGVDPKQVAAATVFSTADVVADMHALSELVRGQYAVEIADLALDPVDGATHERYCELHGRVSYPQFQKGKAPFNKEGLFQIGADGLPVLQGYVDAPVVITIPKRAMPAAGYPLSIYFHGSGGYSTTVVDRGPVTEAGGNSERGKGPAHVIAEHGIAAAGSALNVNPERVPGASDIAYLNFSNLAAFRDTFRQGIIESRLFIDALHAIEIPPSVLAGCTGPSLSGGATAYTFDPDWLVAMGQSMGGMYTNLVSAVEPRILAAVPTGAGGMWGKMVIETELITGVRDLLAVLLGIPIDALSFMHPGMHLIALAWEPAEPLVYMPRLSRRPLAGHPVRSVYEPVGMGDVYFTTEIYDAAALSYGHEQAGEEVWPGMQVSLALAGRDGITAYPITSNLTSGSHSYTGVVVQYEDDGIDDAHYIYAQLDAVKYQYGCFLATLLERGVATVPAPAPLGTPCP